jgi:F-type H+-transporting ATPase subunit b
MLAMSERAGGLFDFNATLPIMALQFIALTTILTFVYYKPVGTLLEERETLISNNLTNASERLLKADELYQQYDEQLKDARNKAQGIIQVAETEAKEIVASEIAQARKDAASLIDKTNRDLEAQKNLALEKLETQVDELSDLIKEKLLGKEVIL